MENIKTINEKLTDEEIKQLEEAKKKPIVFDEDCPETTPERAIKFRRVNPPRRILGQYILNTARHTYDLNDCKGRAFLFSFDRYNREDQEMNYYSKLR